MTLQVYALTMHPVSKPKKKTKEGRLAALNNVDFKSLVSADDANPPKIGQIIKHKLSGIEMMISSIDIVPHGTKIKQSKGFDNDDTHTQPAA